MGAEIKVVLRQVSKSTSEAMMGNHKVLVDRPSRKAARTSVQWAGSYS